MRRNLLRDADYNKALTDTIKEFSQPGPGVNKYSEITANIFITNKQSGTDIPTLKSNNFSMVIAINVDFPGVSGNTENIGNIEKQFKKHKITLKNVSVASDLSVMLPFKLYEQIQNHINSGKRLLVFCNDGCSISPIFVMYFYFMRYYDSNYTKNISVTENLLLSRTFVMPTIAKKIKMGRICASPNRNLLMELIRVEGARKRDLNMHWQEVKKDYKPHVVPITNEEVKRVNRIKAEEIQKRIKKEQAEQDAKIHFDTIDDLFHHDELIELPENVEIADTDLDDIDFE